MKAILISIQPKWVEKILNGEKTIEIRKRFPKDYVGWVYIYCTKDNKNKLVPCYEEDDNYHGYYLDHFEILERGQKPKKPKTPEPADPFDDNKEWCNYYCQLLDYKQFDSRENLNGKVVARFWCDNVTEYINGGQWHDNNTFGSYDDYIKDNILEKSCLTEEELFNYCEDLAFSSIHISQLEIFDKPKDLDSFVKVGCLEKLKHYIENCPMSKFFQKEMPEEVKQYVITKAPQSWCYVEGVE